MEETQKEMPETFEKPKNNKSVAVLVIALVISVLGATVLGALYLANKNVSPAKTAETTKATDTTQSSQNTNSIAVADCSGTPTDPVFTTITPDIVIGESVALNWIGINNADSATIDQNVGDITLTGGNRIVTPATTTIYTLLAKCSKTNQTITKTVTINVKPVFQITSAATTVSPGSYTGACPKVFTFTAKVTANSTGNLTYKWVKSDGSSTAVKTFTFTSSGYANITDVWTPGASMSGWEKIVIITPNALESNQASITLSCQTAEDFSGSWYHNFGTANITQSGSSVTGTYYNGFSGQSGTIAGNVVGSVLTGTWTISGGSGSFKWTINDDTFDGKWNDTYKWCGAKSGKNFASGCGYAGSWKTQVGSTADCSMNLTQNNTTVSGTYCNGTVSGTVSFSGSASEALLTGNWVIGGTHGDINFYLLSYDDKQFQGNYNTSYRWCGARSGSSLPSTCLR